MSKIAAKIAAKVDIVIVAITGVLVFSWTLPKVRKIRPSSAMAITTRGRGNIQPSIELESGSTIVRLNLIVMQ